MINNELMPMVEPILTSLVVDVAPSIVMLYEQEIPKEVLLTIFSHLNCLELAMCSGVNKKEWRLIANDPELLKNALFLEKLFTPKDMGPDWLDSSYQKSAFECLPSDIVEVYKKLGSKYYVIWQPKGLDYKKLTAKLHVHITDDTWDLSNDNGHTAKFKPIPNSWILLPKDVIDDNCFNSNQTKINDNYRADLGNCEIPTTLEIISSINAIFFKTGKMPFRDKCILCEDYNSMAMLVGPDSASSVKVCTEDAGTGIFLYDISLIGIKRLA